MQTDAKIKTKQTKTAKLEIYEKYRNKVIDRIRIRRQSYYQNYFEQNKNNSNILWQGIKNIIYSKKGKKSTGASSIVKGKNISNPHFNNFFTWVGKEIEDIILRSKNNFKNYLKIRNPNNFNSSQTTPGEISDIIQTLNLNKSTGPNSVSLNVLKKYKE